MQAGCSLALHAPTRAARTQGRPSCGAEAAEFPRLRQPGAPRLRACAWGRSQAAELVVLRSARREEARRGGSSPVRGHELEFAAPAPQGFARARGPAGQCGLVSSGHGRGVCALVQQNWYGCLFWGFCRSLVVVQMLRGPATRPALHVPPSRAGACACGRAGGAGT